MRARTNTPHPTPRRTRIGQRAGFSLFEVLLVILIIGVLTAVAIPIFHGLDRVSVTKSKRNAQLTAKLSSNLEALGVAHVLPESLGGAAATTRLLRAGVKFSDEPLDKAYLGIPNLPATEVVPTAQFLKVEYQNDGLHLVYDPGEPKP